MHAVQRLFHYRRSLSTKEFRARGFKVKRCEMCRIAEAYCICELRTQTRSNCSFLLLMYDDEVLKPSNTGRLIADIFPDTHAFLWHRTEPNHELLNVINDDRYQPFVIFPEEYSYAEQTVYNQKPNNLENHKIPLFILLDATWRQAKRMFRKSPYLSTLPIVSIPSPLNTDTNSSGQTVTGDDQLNQKFGVSVNFDSKYQVRKTEKPGQLATAEVAAKVVAMFGEQQNAKMLDLWFDVFSYRYQQSITQSNKANPAAVANFEAFLSNRQQD